MQNQARLKVLKAREDHIRTVLEEAKQKLIAITKDESQYKAVMTKLISQGLCLLVEKEITIRCRQHDVQLVQNCTTAAVDEYKHMTHKPCNVTLDQSSFLGEDT